MSKNTIAPYVLTALKDARVLMTHLELFNRGVNPGQEIWIQSDFAGSLATYPDGGEAYNVKQADNWGDYFNLVGVDAQGYVVLADQDDASSLFRVPVEQIDWNMTDTDSRTSKCVALNDDYNALVTKEGLSAGVVQVGCQEIPVQAIRNLLETIESVERLGDVELVFDGIDSNLVYNEPRVVTPLTSNGRRVVRKSAKKTAKKKTTKRKR